MGKLLEGQPLVLGDNEGLARDASIKTLHEKWSSSAATDIFTAPDDIDYSGAHGMQRWTDQPHLQNGDHDPGCRGGAVKQSRRF